MVKVSHQTKNEDSMSRYSKVIACTDTKRHTDRHTHKQYKNITFLHMQVVITVFTPNLRFLIAVYMDSYVITLGLWAKYDIDGHYSRFAAQILVNSQKKCHKQTVPIFIRMPINISVVFISELVGCMQLTR